MSKRVVPGAAPASGTAFVIADETDAGLSFEPIENRQIQAPEGVDVAVSGEVAVPAPRHSVRAITGIDLLQAVEAGEQQPGAHSSTTDTATCATMSALCIRRRPQPSPAWLLPSLRALTRFTRVPRARQRAEHDPRDERHDQREEQD